MHFPYLIGAIRRRRRGRSRPAARLQMAGKFAGWDVPMWLSAIACVIAAYLAYEGFHIRKST
jgi:hypothetical protein